MNVDEPNSTVIEPSSLSVFNKLCTAIMDKNWDLVSNVCEQCPDQVCQWIITKSNRTQAVYLRKLPIHFACKFHAPKEVIVTLLEIYPNGIKEIDEKGALPLHNFFRNKNLVNNEERMEIVEYLVEKYPESIRVADKKGMLPMHRASATGAHEDMINLLFRDNHLSVLKRDSFGRSPMQLFKRSHGPMVATY